MVTDAEESGASLGERVASLTADLVEYRTTEDRPAEIDACASVRSTMWR